jgi:hypothetical protein
MEYTADFPDTIRAGRGRVPHARASPVVHARRPPQMLDGAAKSANADSAKVHGAGERDGGM